MYMEVDSGGIGQILEVFKSKLYNIYRSYFVE